MANRIKRLKTAPAHARLAGSRAYGENDLFHHLSHIESLTAAWSPEESLDETRHSARR